MIRVTEAIKLAGLLGDAARFFTPSSAELGTAVHVACELDDEGALDPASVHPSVAPYLESWREWKAAAGIEVVASECEVIHEALGIVGHPDRVVRFPDSDRLFILDIKTGAHAAWHAIQAALYALAWQATHGGPTPRRGGVYLHASGRPGTYMAFKETRDLDVAKAVCAVAHWRKANQ